jgi:hypothetical protein
VQVENQHLRGERSALTNLSKTDPRRDSVSRNRWVVHFALILGYVAAVASAIFLSRKYLGHSGTTDHAIIGLLVFALVIVHLIQRRHTVRRLAVRLFGHSPGRQSRQAASDTILWILMLNTMASGAADFIVGHTILLPIPGPYLFQKWHLMSALVLLIYVIVHVVRRRKRILTSRVT